MSYDNNKEDREKRRKKLVTGLCGCGRKAQIPWEGGKYCYKCFNQLMDELRKVRGEK